MTRRRFIRQMNTAAAGIALGGPLARRAAGGAFRLDPPTVSVAHVSSYGRRAIRSALEAMFGQLGGLGDIVRPGDHVGIKINLTGGHGWATSYYNETGGKHPGETFWTHPEVLRAVGQLLLDAGAGRLTILEAIYDEESYAYWGYSAVAGGLGADFVDLNGKAPYSGYATRSVGDDAFIYGELVQNGVLNDLDCMVSLAKSKRHNGAGITHGMKNLVGTLPLPVGIYNDGQGHRAAIHSLTHHDGNTYNNLRRVILDLNHATPIQLVVNDAITTVLGGEGPWGPPLTPVAFDTLVAGKDPVAADSIATQTIGFDPYAPDGAQPYPDGLNYLRLAEQHGMGTANPDHIKVVTASPTNGEGEQPVAGSPTLDVYPNPFSSLATFVIDLPAAAFGRLDVFDLTGRTVGRLLDRSLPFGSTTIEWTAQGPHGRLPAGVYVARLLADGSAVHRTVVRS